ncbi:TM1812 family CRISPR-associated protein [Thermonema rossianum]|uniref:TM1812 family CRISPR-associated protein n=1 Tax=Thermonema rossianum TaxID=55505 RepID=UPI0005702293|nr:TM1812 family CRISPR-associated protein [Thermonema rossianum]
METKRLILQVARLDRNYKKEVHFSFFAEDEQYTYEGKAPVSALFWKNEVLKENSRILFLFPFSLPLQDFSGCTDEYLQYCSQIDQARYRPSDEAYAQEVARKHPFIENESFLMLSCIGKYKVGSHLYEFEEFKDRTIDDITLEILSCLVNEYSDIEELYVDITAGHNLYVTAMLSAVMRFIPIYELMHGFKKQLKAMVLYSDPIVPGIDKVNLYVSPFRARGFMELPLRNVDPNQIKSLVSTLWGKDKRRMESFYLEYFPALFFSIKQGFVLLIPKLIKHIEEELKIRPDDLLIQQTFSKSIDKKKRYSMVYAFFFCFAMYKGFYEKFKGFPDKLVVRVERQGEKVEISGIEEEERWKSAFDDCHLKDVFGSFKSELQKLIKEVDNTSYQKNPRFDPRNFVAHAGLEKNMTKLSKKEADCYEVTLSDGVLSYIKKIVNECKK